MQEIVAMVRANMVAATKNALSKAGCPSFSCTKCLGRGKKGMDPATLRMVMESGELPRTPAGESLTEVGRLIPKRLFNICVPDEKVEHRPPRRRKDLCDAGGRILCGSHGRAR